MPSMPALANHMSAPTRGLESVPRKNSRRQQDHAPAAERTLTVLERYEKLHEMMGDAAPFGQVFAEAVRSLVSREYDAHVLPLIEQHWPASLQEPVGRKLRFLACHLYASAPYTVLFCSPRRPWVLDAVIRTSQWIGLTEVRIAQAARMGLSALGRVALRDEHRRIILISAFIATIDHAFDHCLEADDPVVRGDKIRGLLEGTWTPDIPSLRLVRALQLAMAEHLTAENRPVFEAALCRVIEWSEAEVKGLSGVEDPHGLCHRLAGIEGTIDGLIFPVHHFAGEPSRQWMYDVSLFVQMMDDWIDYEKDRQDTRQTPVINGAWSYVDIEEKWRETVRGIESLASASGLESEAYRRFVRHCYVYMMRDVMEAMAKGIAA